MGPVNCACAVKRWSAHELVLHERKSRGRSLSHLTVARTQLLTASRQLYPWRGFGIDGSVGFHEGQWGVDLYFDVYNSLMSSPLPGIQQSTTQGSNIISGGILFSQHF